MDLFEAIDKRRSIRKFKAGEEVSEEAVLKILGAAIKAPSAGNGQSWHFEVVRDSKMKKRLATEAGHQPFIAEAPVDIVVCSDLRQAEMGYGVRGRDTYALQETAAAIQNMLLVITALGLGTCWVGAFDEGEARRILGLPPNIRPLAILPIGVPADPETRIPPKKGIDEVVRFR